MRLLTSSIFVLALVAMNVCGQTSTATKFDSYGRLGTDDEAANLDLFYEQLRDHPNMRGYLIGYTQQTGPHGVLLRRLYGDQRYLIEIRGVEPNRLTAIDGGYRPTYTIEHWLVPSGATPPVPTFSSVAPGLLNKRDLFDEECLGCEPTFNLDLYVFTDGIRFYADALRKNPNARGLIVVRPGQHVSAREALNRARKAKRDLIRAHKIDADRLTISLARRRKDNLSMAEMWIID
jgi:hypothetical protein